jgi:hypothetical protein
LVPATVAECERLQTEWNRAIAVAGGGSVWEDEDLRWAWQPHNGHLMLNFPRSIDARAARRGVEFAREHEACVVGAWLSPDTDADPQRASSAWARGSLTGITWSEGDSDVGRSRNNVQITRG